MDEKKKVPEQRGCVMCESKGTEEQLVHGLCPKCFKVCRDWLLRIDLLDWLTKSDVALENRVDRESLEGMTTEELFELADAWHSKKADIRIVGTGPA